MGTHEKCVGATDEWYTPPFVFEAMGVRFDVDVATHERVHWVPADEHITDFSLVRPWSGFAWMNPPFGKRNGLVPWLNKFITHRNGVCLVPDRTSAPWWQHLAGNVDLILFVTPKIKFLDADLNAARSPPQGTCLCAIGEQARPALRNASNLGTLLAPSSPRSNHETEN